MGKKIMKLFLFLFLFSACGDNTMTQSQSVAVSNGKNKCERILDEKPHGEWLIITICDGETIATDSYYNYDEALAALRGY